MISLRQHTVSIAAVFLALAGGVVLGSTSLSERLLAAVWADHASMSDQVDTLRTERNQLRGELAGSNRFIHTVGPMTVQDQLDQRKVALISTPDVSVREKVAVRTLLDASGADVTSEMQLTDSMIDPNRADHLRNLVSRVSPPGMRLPIASDPGTLAGGLLGPLTLLDPSSGTPQSSPEERAAAVQGLVDSGFLRASPDFEPAQLAVVLTGGEATGDRPSDQAALLARFATQVDRSGSGTVLVGRSGAASGKGAVGVARADSSISSMLSTVDNFGTASGQIASVLALREQWEGDSGHYGVAGSAQGDLPNPRG